MVIVVFHALASAFLYLRDRLFMVYQSPRLADRNFSNDTRHIGRGSDTSQQRRSVGDSGCFRWRTSSRSTIDIVKDAFLPILDATNVSELREAVYTSLVQCLPRVEHLQVFLKNPVTNETEANGVPLPKRGILWNTFHQSKIRVCPLPPAPDPVLSILELRPSDPYKVLLLPISSSQSDCSLGIAVGCFKSPDSLSIEEEKCLNVLLKQVSVAYFAVRRPQLDTVTDNSRLESLISLCGELHDQDAATLELKVIRYLREQTRAESGFLLLVVPETLELISQVVGNTILPEEVRFHGLWSCFKPALETKQPLFLEHIPQDQRKEVEKIVQRKVENFLCVPVTRKGSEDLIALACLVNKCKGEQFSETDIQIVLQCFKYTSTVLASTLAFQNERKLKNQTQALLQVAKKLFTHLGESEKCNFQRKRPQLLGITRLFMALRIKHLHDPDQEEDINQSMPFPKLTGSSMRTFGLGKQDKSQDGQTSTSISKKKQVTIIQRTNSETIPGREADLSTSTTSMDHLTELELDELIRKRMQARRARIYSMSVFRMYDPTCDEAISDSEISSQEDDEEKPVKVVSEVPLSSLTSMTHQPTAMQTQESSVDSPPGSSSQPNMFPTRPSQLTVAGPSSAKDVYVQNFKTVLSPPPDTFSLKSPFPASKITHHSSANRMVSSGLSNSKHFKAANVEPSTDSPYQNHTFVIKKKARTILQNAAVPLSLVKTMPPSRFDTPWDYNAYPYIRRLLDLAPSDAQYSDGDFMYDLTKLLREIMQEARNLTDSERCSVFLLDQDSDELVATVFDGITTNNKEWMLRNGVQSEIRLPKTQGIAGHVATTGTLLNIKDAYSHPLFYRGIDDSTGFRTRNILCFPIKDEDGVVLGVAQLCNKKTGTYFTTFDEDIASAFAVYCCISISHSLMYKKVIDIQTRNSLANELMMFHMKCLIYKKMQDAQHRHMLANELMRFHMQQIPLSEVQELAKEGTPKVTVFHKDFDKFSFPPRAIRESRTPGACQAMFEDLGFTTRWRLKPDTLARFLLMVKKGYRNPPYHNWMHAFSVAHFGYLCIKNLHLTNHLDDIELFALFVSCLCHDIDHRGTTNSFQVKSQSVLAALYSSEGSVMERHHLAQSMCILNTEGSNIFENLSSKEYQQMLDLMKDIILATDVAHHLRIFNSLEDMARDGYDKKDPKCHDLLLCLLMTAADLSDQTKTWDNTKHTAVLIYQEFFSQGDLEKALGESPLEMMDREKACVPDLQISFLDNIAIPVYVVLADLFEEANEVKQNVENNRMHWVHKATMLKQYTNNKTMSVQEIIALGEDVSSSSEDATGSEEKMETSQHNGR